MVIEENDYKIPNGFLEDIQEFERAVKDVKEMDMLSISPKIAPWLNYIMQKHIDMNNSDYKYVDKFINILKKNNIRWTLIVCFTTKWALTLDKRMNNDKTFGGRVRLCQYMVADT